LKVNPEYGLFLFAFNPLMILEIIINGHNDGLLILFSLLALLALQRQWHTVAIAMALLSTLVKLSGILLLIGVVVYLMRQRQWRGLIYSLIGSFIVLVALKMTLFPNVQAMRSLLVTAADENSIFGMLVRRAKKSGIYVELVRHGFLQIHSVVFALFCIWRLSKIRDFYSLVRETIYLNLGLIIGYSIQFRPWYVTWLIPYAAIIKSKQLQQMIVLFSFTVLAFYAVPGVYRLPENSFNWTVLQVIITYAIPLGWIAVFRGRMRANNSI
jgi:hypothetical protein